MAALDPTAKPKDEAQPKRATLKLMRRPLQNPVLDDDESEESEDDESEDEESAKKVIGKKGSKKDAPVKKGRVEDTMDIENDDDDDDDVSDDDDDYEVEEFTICTLDSERVSAIQKKSPDFPVGFKVDGNLLQHYQQPLDITIGEDEMCYFKVIGNYDISLTGNYVVASNYRGLDDDSENEDEDYDLSPSEDELNMYGEESESDDLDNLEDPRIQEIATDEETEVKHAEKKANKKAGKKSLKRAAEEVEHEDLSLDELIAKSKEVKEAVVTPEKKLSKKQLKKLKANDGKAVDATAEAKAKKVQFAKKLEQGPTPSPAADKKTKEQKKPEVKKPEAAGKSSKVVQGVTIMDSKVGTGAAAKRGNKLSMRYIGKLESGKVFDSNTKGKPFTFSLGKGEVIKGWDVGLEGMQVGGERRLRIPAAAAYGGQASPGIPANSTLIFDGTSLR